MYRLRSVPFELLRPVLLSPKPMILPPVVVDVLTHASSENVCGPDCQYGDDALHRRRVVEVPGKFVAVSVSLSSAPAMLRVFALLSVRSLEPDRS